jgi:glycosyltransferase involved in cell wall biosynthesis
MKIAQVPPLIESVPPKGYGGTERIVSFITEELVRRGHDVTLFASGDSETKAHLVPICPKGLRLFVNNVETLAYHYVQLDQVTKQAREFDIIHFHNDYLHFPMSRVYNYTHVTTLHGRLDNPGIPQLYKRYNDIPLVSISNHQREPIPFANWIDTVYHGLPDTLYKQGKGEGNYLAFLGRISIEKRPDRAIEIAKRTGIKLKVAAKIDNADKEYYESVKHLFDDPLVEFVGEIGEDKKEEFLGNAAALLFPIDWPEPFGLVVIESMACGTPVIAFREGSIPEIIDDGITGYSVSSIDEAVDSVNKVQNIDRSKCRQKFEERFEVSTMVDNYERVYSQLIERKNNEKQNLYTMKSSL